MSIAAQVTLPAPFIQKRPGVWGYNNLRISLNDGWCDKSYEDTARSALRHNFVPDMPQITGFGYSVKEAVKALNLLLKQIGIPEYSLEGLPGDHGNVCFEGTYVYAWEAVHLCTSAMDMDKKRHFCKMYHSSFEQDALVILAMETLFASKRRVMRVLPLKRTFVIEWTKRGYPALWIIGEFPPLRGNFYLLTGVNGNLSSSYCFKTRRHLYDPFVRDLLVEVHMDDIILPGEGVVNAEDRGDHHVIQVYRVVEIQEHQVVCRREFLSSALLPNELRKNIDGP